MINVVITYADIGLPEYRPLIEIAFASAKRFGYKTILIEGKTTKGQLMPWVLEAQKKYIDSEDFTCNTVLFSPDCLVNRRLEPVFDLPFDLGVTQSINPDYPINNGVIYIRPEHKNKLSMLWQDFIDRCYKYEARIQKWYGDQKSMHDVLADAHDKPYGLKVKRLLANKYNASFIDNDKYADNNKLIAGMAYVLHFKGKRKSQMLNYDLS